MKTKISESLIYYLSSFAAKSVQILILTIYTRFINPADLGSYYMFLFLSTILSYVFFGNANSTTKHFLLKSSEIKAKDLSQYSLIFIGLISLLSCFLLLFFSFDIRYIYFSFILGLSIFTENFLLGMKNYLHVTYLNFAKIIFELVILYYLISIDIQGFDLRFYPFFISLSLPSLLIILMFRKTIFKNFFNYDFKKSKQIFRYSTPILIHTILFTILNQSNRYIIGNLYGDEYSGYFSVMQTFGNVIVLISMFYNTIMIDKLYNFFDSDDYNKIAEYLNTYIRIISVSSVAVYSSLQLFLSYFLSEVYFSYFFIITFIFISNIFFIFYLIFSIKLNFHERGKKIALNYFLSIISGLAVSYLLIMNNPWVGISLSILIYNLLLFLFYFDAKIFKTIKLKTYLIILSSLIFIVAIYFINSIIMALICILLTIYYINTHRWKSLF